VPHEGGKHQIRVGRMGATFIVENAADAWLAFVRMQEAAEQKWKIGDVLGEALAVRDGTESEKNDMARRFTRQQARHPLMVNLRRLPMMGDPHSVIAPTSIVTQKRGEIKITQSVDGQTNLQVDTYWEEEFDVVTAKVDLVGLGVDEASGDTFSMKGANGVIALKADGTLGKKGDSDVVLVITKQEHNLIIERAGEGHDVQAEYETTHHYFEQIPRIPLKANLTINGTRIRAFPDAQRGYHLAIDTGDGTSMRSFYFFDIKQLRLLFLIMKHAAEQGRIVNGIMPPEIQEVLNRNLDTIDKIAQRLDLPRADAPPLAVDLNKLTGKGEATGLFGPVSISVMRNTIPEFASNVFFRQDGEIVQLESKARDAELSSPWNMEEGDSITFQEGGSLAVGDENDNSNAVLVVTRMPENILVVRPIDNEVDVSIGYNTTGTSSLSSPVDHFLKIPETLLDVTLRINDQKIFIAPTANASIKIAGLEIPPRLIKKHPYLVGVGESDVKLFGDIRKARLTFMRMKQAAEQGRSAEEALEETADLLEESAEMRNRIAEEFLNEAEHPLAIDLKALTTDEDKKAGVGIPINETTMLDIRIRKEGEMEGLTLEATLLEPPSDQSAEPVVQRYITKLRSWRRMIHLI